MGRRVALFFLFLALSQVARATDFPTIETVRLVMGCMADLGELSDENLYTCTCEHDVLAGHMSFLEYEEGVTYERNRAMPGEKGGFFRDNKRGQAYFDKLVQGRIRAKERCIAVKRVGLRQASP